jgi:hypothetical protein
LGGLILRCEGVLRLPRVLVLEKSAPRPLEGEGGAQRICAVRIIVYTHITAGHHAVVFVNQFGLRWSSTDFTPGIARKAT